ncbi:DUF1385 domain-containing protein [Candidatus Marinimicrobia bacterium]|nr:DUF1385 domain-containing protein [Candidatus Neomarinimicrobiota bacterium]
MKRLLLLLTMKPNILVGGQAVIEGVMMRVPGAYSTAVRDPKGNLRLKRENFASITQSSTFWSKPIIRGIASLYEAMKMGMSTLQWSADISYPEESNNDSNFSKFLDTLTTFISISLAILLFMVLPMWLTTQLLNIEKDAILFNLSSGAFRILFFIIYLFLISRIKDVSRLFQYHGAEHKVVYNFESGKDISIKNAQSFSTLHPRCGTSFMFIVLLSAIFVFAAVDTITIYFFGKISLSIRLLSHLPLIPLVSGVGYELIKITSKSESIIFRILKKPGILLQNITTREPDDKMVEVSIAAIKDAFGDEYEEYRGKQFTAEAIE